MESWPITPEALQALGAVISAGGALWAGFHRLDRLLRARIREHAASKEDLARVEGKIDTLLLVVAPTITRKGHFS